MVFGGDLPKDPHLKVVQKQYELNKSQIKRLWRIFVEADRDRSGSLSIKEFCKCFSERPSAFLYFLVGDVSDGDFQDEMSFGKFVHVICRLSLMTENDVIQLAFETFDDDDSGDIDAEECKYMVQELTKYSSSGVTSFLIPVAAAVESVDDGDGLIDLDEFVALNHHFPHLLWPLYRLQYRIQEQTLGMAVWKKHARKFKFQTPDPVRRCSCFLLQGRKAEFQPVGSEFWKEQAKPLPSFKYKVGPASEKMAEAAELDEVVAIDEEEEELLD